MQVQFKTDAEREIYDLLISTLPPVIARKSVPQSLGGIISAQTLANLDCQGDGPDGAFRLGSQVFYRTDKFVPWLIQKYGVRSRAPRI